MSSTPRGMVGKAGNRLAIVSVGAGKIYPGQSPARKVDVCDGIGAQCLPHSPYLM